MTTITDPAPAPARDRAADDTSLAEEVRTAGMVWKRELIRFARTRIRILTGLTQPLLFLFVLGYGMASLVGTTAGFDFKKFVFPGVVAMSVVSTAIFSAMSIVWDREFGFLREMLVAPVSRTALVLGKTAGGATVATAQGTIMLVLAPLIGVHLTGLLVLEVVGAELLMAIALTAFGVFIASRIARMESFQVVMQLVLLPMLMLSGAMFPLSGLPHWLAAITRINPLTYAVDPLRQAVFAAQQMPLAARERFPVGVELFGHTLPVGLELGIVAAFAVVFLTIAVRAFGKPE
ncbi:MAG: ABC transporter permease [Actinobacteria bacterium]|nr:ABC transporter permease [Actinomycetota bacterium]